MTSFFRKRAIRYPLLILSLLGLMAAAFLLLSKFWIGLLFTILFVATAGFAWKMEDRTYVETEKHIETLAYRVKKVGEKAFHELPIGILLINEKNIIEWANPYAMSVFGTDSLIGDELFDLSEQFRLILNGK